MAGDNGDAMWKTAHGALRLSKGAKSPPLVEITYMMTMALHGGRALWLWLP